MPIDLFVPSRSLSEIGFVKNEDVQSLFASHGLRCTRQRAVIYDALARSNQHPTADELYRQCSVRADGLSLATVYNTLDALCDAGLVRRLSVAGGNGSARYDAVTADHGHHLHARDQATGEVYDVPDDLGQRILEQIPAELLKEIEEKLGFKVNQVQIELVGERSA